MKTAILSSALVVALAAPAFADDGLEGRILSPGERNDVSVSAQLLGGVNANGLAAPQLIALDHAMSSDDALAAYAIRTGGEVISTQNTAGVGTASQIADALGVDGEMSRSALTRAYFSDVAD